MTDPYSLSHARFLDNQDPLKSFRDRFIIKDPSLVYLDGNSLGRLPSETVRYLDKAIREQWGRLSRQVASTQKRCSWIRRRIDSIMGAFSGALWRPAAAGGLTWDGSLP